MTPPLYWPLDQWRVNLSAAAALPWGPQMCPLVSSECLPLSAPASGNHNSRQSQYILYAYFIGTERMGEVLKCLKLLLRLPARVWWMNSDRGFNEAFCQLGLVKDIGHGVCSWAQVSEPQKCTHCNAYAQCKLLQINAVGKVFSRNHFCFCFCIKYSQPLLTGMNSSNLLYSVESLPSAEQCH